MKIKTCFVLFILGVACRFDPGVCFAQDDSSRPVVIKTVPEDGSTNVPPGEFEIRVTFSRDMADKTWSWVGAWDNSTPQGGQPRYEADRRTCVLKANLEPGRRYGIWLNTERFSSFRDTQGRPAVPYLLSFQTGRDSSAPSREECWRQDIQLIETELPKRHRDFYKLVSKTDFKRNLTSLREDAEKLSDADIILRLMRVIAGVGVAHTSLDWSAIAPPFRKYPLWMQWCSDGLVVISAAPEYRAALGARVLRIGLSTPEQLEQEIKAYIPHENPAWLRQQSPDFMVLVELLQHLNVADPDGSVEWLLAKQDGQPFALRVMPAKSVSGQKQIQATEVLKIPTPMYRRQPGAYYCRKFLPQSRTLYIQYNRCSEAPNHPFARFAEESVADALRQGASRVVVDLRLNGGGNSEVINPLIKKLKQQPGLSGKGQVKVLIGGHTFSSGVMGAMYFQNRLQARLIGQPTGGKPNCYGEVRSFTLPNSRLTVRYSTKHFRPLSKSDPGSLEPDVTVPFTIQDFLAGRDPVLEAALNDLLP